ncbi:hypothetical protein R6Z07F_014545 [Ovis aries]
MGSRTAAAGRRDRRWDAAGGADVRAAGRGSKGMRAETRCSFRRPHVGTPGLNAHCSHRGEAAEKGVEPGLSFLLPRVLLQEAAVPPQKEAAPGRGDRRPLGGFSGDGAL